MNLEAVQRCDEAFAHCIEKFHLLTQTRQAISIGPVYGV